MKLLQHKVIFLTGGSSGIGLECARKYLQHGATVVIVSNDATSLKAAGEALAIPATDCLLADVADPAGVQQAIAQTLQLYGRIDVIHNNAGVANPVCPLHQTSDEDWQQVFDVNVKSILLTTRYGLQALKETKGCIINTSSLVAEIGQENHAAYAASKGAVNALTKSMALDYAPFKIRVNAVAPAGVWTEMLRSWVAAQEDPSSMEAYLNHIHPLGYCPNGDVIADACVFLASKNAQFITGCILPVSGGAELGYRTVLE